MLTSVRYVLSEHKKNMGLIGRMAVMDSQKQTLRTSIGIAWTYFHDLLYFGVFLLFRFLISGSGEIMGMNQMVYLVTGMIPWFFMSDVLNQGSMAIRSGKGIIQSIRFPAVILPTISVAGIFIKRILSFLLIFAVSFGFGYGKSFHPILFVYYMFCMICLAIALNLVLTAIIAISEDFRQLHNALLRVMIYTMPIIWDFSRVKAIWSNVLLRINPIVYVVKGFRDAFVLGMTQDLLYTLYFWGVVIGLFSVGSFLQYKLKKYYADFM